MLSTIPDAVEPREDDSNAVYKPTFDEAYTEIARIVSSRRGGWTYLSILPWEDVSQELFIRIYQKWHLYDPIKAPHFENWVNTLISNAFLNLRRDHYLRLAKPCVGGGMTNGKSCAYNQGGDLCGFTRSGKQCAECPVFAEWEKKRKYQFNVKAQVTIENHSQEVSNIQRDFVDYDNIKIGLDKAMLKELTRWEGKIYKALFQRNMTPTQVSEWLEKDAKTRKRPLGPHEQTSYQNVLRLQRDFKQMMHEVLRRQGHIDDEWMDRPNR